MTLDRDLLRAASAVRDRLLAIRGRPERLVVPAESARELVTLSRQLERAMRHGWSGAATRLWNRLWNVVTTHRARVDELAQILDAPRPRLPGLRELHADLVALRDEFDEVRFDRTHRRLIVRTEPIRLEEVDLGPFDVVLQLRYLAETTPYDVVAVEPRPAAASRDVTHPHVDNERLCEGDGRAVIRRALDEGRLYDFFTVVNRILQTYNAGSAYVPLASWDGVECDACGVSLGDDEGYACHGCSAELCEDCSPICGDCGHAHCTRCLVTCSACEQEFCERCLRPCSDCGDSLCERHLDGQRCEHCREAAETEENEATEETRAPADARRVGQAAVPA